MAQPAASSPQFRITTDRARRLIRYKLTGLWDIETFARYERAMDAEIRSLQAMGLSFDMIGDLTNFPTQPQFLNELRQEMIRKAKAKGLRKCAIIATSSLVKLQVGRLSDASYAFFSSENEAENWLKS